MGSFPCNLLLLLLPTCLAWGCNFNDDSLTGEEQALCFLSLLRHYRERLNDASKDQEVSAEILGNSNEEGNYFRAQEEDVTDDDDDNDDDDEDKMAEKRGKLDQNFLRFGRLSLRSSDSEKRAALDRNFLRFGRSIDRVMRSKRAAEIASGPGMRYTRYRDETSVPSQRSLHLAKGFLSPEKLHLMRELSRKRGALERNFLRFGRSSEVQGDHPIDKRAALDRNFLRFGRRDSYDKKAALDRNFLRFGRNPHQESDREGDFPEEKRAALDRNFLRFGKSDNSFHLLHNGEKDEGVKRSASDDSKDSSKVPNAALLLRFGQDPSHMRLPVTDIKRAQLDRNFLRFGRRNWETEESDGDFELHQKRDVNHQVNSNLDEHRAEEEEEEKIEEAKRGALDKNFLRFGRRQFDLSAFNRNHYQNTADSSKRAALDRNFLRFGKRKETGRVHKTLAENSKAEQHAEQHDEENNVSKMTLAP